jgi:hypothetical protein
VIFVSKPKNVHSKAFLYSFLSKSFPPDPSLLAFRHVFYLDLYWSYIYLLRSRYVATIGSDAADPAQVVEEGEEPLANEGMPLS